jgi:hypothetical protein
MITTVALYVALSDVYAQDAITVIAYAVKIAHVRNVTSPWTSQMKSTT